MRPNVTTFPFTTKICTWKWQNLLQSGQSWSQFITTDSLKVTLSISCRAEKCPALFPELSGRYSTTLHCTRSTLLWAQACGLDLGEWAHPIYIQAISNRSQRHMHIHNHIDSLSQSFSSLCSLSQQCSLRSRDKPEKEKQRQRDPRHEGDLLPRQAVHSSPTVRESLILAPAARYSLASLTSPSLSSLPGRSRVTSPQTPDLQAP